MNLVQAAIYAEPEVRVIVDLGSHALELPWRDPRAASLAAYHTARVTVGVRPDALTAVAGPGGDQALRGVVRAVDLRGHDALVHVETGCAPTPYEVSHLEFPDAPGELSQVAAEEMPRPQPVRERLLRLVPQRRPEASIRYSFQPAYDPGQAPARQAQGDLTLRMSASVAPRPGDTLALTVDLDRIYLFDGAGDRIRLPGALTLAPEAPQGAA
jgi:multiple sugar transport system ATP-binding protein